jgi:hypothetical protein
LSAGDHIENECLRLGAFAQDLAQELDLNACAVHPVTARAHEGLAGDVLISDQEDQGLQKRKRFDEFKHSVEARKLGQPWPCLRSNQAACVVWMRCRTISTLQGESSQTKFCQVLPCLHGQPNSDNKICKAKSGELKSCPNAGFC